MHKQIREEIKRKLIAIKKYSRRNKGGQDKGYDADVSNSADESSDNSSSDISPIPIVDDDLDIDNSEDMISLGPQPEQDSTFNTTNEDDSHVPGIGAPPANGDANNLNMTNSSNDNNNNGSLHLSDLNYSQVSSNGTSLPADSDDEEAPQQQGGTKKRRRRKSKKAKKTKKTKKSKKTRKSKKSRK
jgi:hypothetical protein